MKNQFKNCKRIFILLVVTFCCGALSARAQQPDFSGNWQVDTLKSTFHGFSSQSAPLEIQMTQKNGEITVIRHQVIGENDINYTEKMSFDGKPITTDIIQDVTRTSTIKWSADGRSLIEASDYSIGQQATETWTLSSDGKMLTIQKEIGTNGKKINMAFVYDKIN